MIQKQWFKLSHRVSNKQTKKTWTLLVPDPFNTHVSDHKGPTQLQVLIPNKRYRHNLHSHALIPENVRGSRSLGRVLTGHNCLE